MSTIALMVCNNCQACLLHVFLIFAKKVKVYDFMHGDDHRAYCWQKRLITYNLMTLQLHSRVKVLH